MVYFGPQTKKLLTIMYLDPNGLFFGRLHFGPYIGYTCMLRPQIFMCTIETDQGLLAHIPGGRRSPKILIVILIEARVITWVQFLETPPKKKNWDGKTKKIIQNSARFLTTFHFDREYLRN